MPNKTHLVECPFCRATMEVVADSGRVINKWEKRDKALPTDEKFKEALTQEKQSKEKLSEYFQSAQLRMEQTKKKTDELFRENLKKIQKSE